MTLVFVMVGLGKCPRHPRARGQRPGADVQHSSNRVRCPGADVRHLNNGSRHLRPSYPLFDRRSRTSTTIPVARPSNPPGKTVDEPG